MFSLILSGADLGYIESVHLTDFFFDEYTYMSIFIPSWFISSRVVPGVIPFLALSKPSSFKPQRTVSRSEILIYMFGGNVFNLLSCEADFYMVILEFFLFFTPQLYWSPSKSVISVSEVSPFQNIIEKWKSWGVKWNKFNVIK